jgi:hypothetical protein
MEVSKGNRGYGEFTLKAKNFQNTDENRVKIDSEIPDFSRFLGFNHP